MSPVKASMWAQNIAVTFCLRIHSAGRYVPYFSAAMLDANDKTYYDLNGKRNI